MAKKRTQATTEAPGATGSRTHDADGGFDISVLLAAGIFFGLALLYFLPSLMPGRGIFGTDYLAGGYPFTEFIAGRFRDLELPKWVPYVYGGMPLFANAGSTFYPPWTLSMLLVPAAYVLPLLFLVQFGLAGLGMFLLLRELAVRSWIALIGGLAFQFTGLTLSYVYAGHDGRVIVATLAPLFLFFLHRLVRTGGTGAFIGATATLAASLLSFQVQSNYYLLLAGLAWGIFALVSHRLRGRVLATRLALGLGAVALAFVLNAVNFLPFLEYVDQSPRGGEEGRGYEYATSWDMAPREITGLAIPEIVGASVADPTTGEPEFPEYTGHNAIKFHTEYVGAFVLLLLGIGAWYNRRDPRWWFFLGVGVFMLTISLGGHTPLYRLYYELLPGTRRFRAPSISFFLVSMSLVAMAGLALERLARARSGGGGRTATDPLSAARWIAIGAGALALVLLLAGGAAAGGGAGGASAEGIRLGYARFALFLGASAGVLWAWLSGRMGSRALLVVLGLVVVTDLWIVGRRFFHTVPPPAAMFAADDVVRALRAQPEEGRVWVLPGAFTGRGYHGEGNYLMLHDLDQAGGEHPNPLQRWYEYVGEGQGHYVDWHNFLNADAAFLNAANVRWIVSMAQLEGVPQLPPLRLVHGGPSALIYENTAALPRAYLVGDVRVTDDPDGALEIMSRPEFDPRLAAVVHEAPALSLTAGPVAGEARITESSPDEVVIATRAERAAFLVLADNYYDGWEARVDGEITPILRTNHTLRGVAVPAGQHEVVFRFRPARMLLGFWIYLIGMLTMAGYAVWALVRTRRRTEARA